MRTCLDLDGAVAAGGFHEPPDGPAGPGLDPSADCQGGEDDGQVRFRSSRAGGGRWAWPAGAVRAGGQVRGVALDPGQGSGFVLELAVHAPGAAGELDEPVPAAAAAAPPEAELGGRALLATLFSVIAKARRHRLRLLVTPDTILRWHSDIVRRRWATRSMRGRTGRPAVRRNIKALVLRLARENTEWGYRRIHGEPAGLGVAVAASTVWEILKASGVDPAPLRRIGPTWPQFLSSQADAILAWDLFTADCSTGPRPTSWP